MKQHAIDYNFDRMKAIFIILFLLTASIIALTENKKRKLMNFLAFILCISSIFNFIFYTKFSTFYFEKVDYLRDNKIISSNISKKYNSNNSILFHENNVVRGYSNLLFGRGIYECLPFEEAIKIANIKNKRYIISLKVIPHAGEMFEYIGYLVYDTLNNEVLEEFNKNEIINFKHSVEP